MSAGLVPKILLIKELVRRLYIFPLIILLTLFTRKVKEKRGVA
jgi:hypothetical protein